MVWLASSLLRQRQFRSFGRSRPRRFGGELALASRRSSARFHHIIAPVTTMAAGVSPNSAKPLSWLDHRPRGPCREPDTLNPAEMQVLDQSARAGTVHLPACRSGQKMPCRSSILSNSMVILTEPTRAAVHQRIPVPGGMWNPRRPPGIYPPGHEREVGLWPVFR